MYKSVISGFLIKVALICGLVVACTTAGEKQHLKNVKQAQALRGQSFDEVAKVLGAPSDKNAAKGPDVTSAYWFLSQEDSTFHPSPSPVLYRFDFKDKRLVNIKEAGK